MSRVSKMGRSLKAVVRIVPRDLPGKIGVAGSIAEVAIAGHEVTGLTVVADPSVVAIAGVTGEKAGGPAAGVPSRVPPTSKSRN